jgi:hypothetical protein
MDVYDVIGKWADNGMFNGYITQNNKKFGAVVRIRMDIISVTPSKGKELMFQQFKKYLITNKLKRFIFLTDAIDNYIITNPHKKIKLI